MVFKKGNIPWIKGKHHRDTTKKQISKTLKGRPQTPEHRKKISNALTGIKRPYQVGENNPAKRPEVRKKISDAMKGTRNPAKRPEVRKKISEANRGEGHPNYGKPRSEETKRKMSKSQPKGENHYLWKGDDVKVVSVHRWIRKIKPKSEVCEMCEEKKRLELSFLGEHGKYTRNPEDYWWLCRSCHTKFDGIGWKNSSIIST